MAKKWAVYRSTEWICDVVADTEEQALKIAQDVDPKCDHVQLLCNLD